MISAIEMKIAAMKIATATLPFFNSSEKWISFVSLSNTR